MEPFAVERIEKDLILYLAGLLKNRASTIKRELTGQGGQEPALQPMEQYSREIKTLTQCLEAVGQLFLSRMKRGDEGSQVFHQASDEMIEQIEQINVHLEQIKVRFDPETCQYN